MLKLIYTFFLGLLLALFVGIGVATFYQAPKYPETPAALLDRSGVDKEMTQEQKDADKTYQQAQKDYQTEFKHYNRNASIITLVFAVVFLVIGLLVADRIAIFGDGLVLGGVFTLIYSIIRGLLSEDLAYRFIVVTVSLAIALVVGYLKFLKPEAKK